MACILYIDDYGRISTWENCVRVALESSGEISIVYNDGSDNDSYFYSKGYVYYNGSEINEGWSWRDDDTTSEITITISDKIEQPSNPGGSGDKPSDEGYNLTISYYCDSTLTDTETLVHYGARLNDENGNMVLYYDEYGSETDYMRYIPSGYEFDRIDTNLSINNHTYGDAYINYYFNKIPKLTIHVVPDTNWGYTIPENEKEHEIRDSKTKLQAISNNGYKFKGWTLNQDGTNIFDTSTITDFNISSDTIVYAVFEESIPNKIITESELHLKTRKLYSNTSNYCPTLQQIKQNCGAIQISNNYANNQCVKEYDVSFTKPYFKVYYKFDDNMSGYIESLKLTISSGNIVGTFVECYIPNFESSSGSNNYPGDSGSKQFYIDPETFFNNEYLDLDKTMCIFCDTKNNDITCNLIVETENGEIYNKTDTSSQTSKTLAFYPGLVRIFTNVQDFSKNKISLLFSK